MVYILVEIVTKIMLFLIYQQFSATRHAIIIVNQHYRYFTST